MCLAASSPLQSSVTYQISHKCQVQYGEERCQHIQPHTVECSHIHHHEVHVDGTHDQDHQTSSYLKHPAEKRTYMLEVKMIDTVVEFASVSYDKDELTIRWQTHS